MTLRGRKCSACGARMPANMKYCGMCGHKLDPDDTANIPPVVSSQLVDELLGGEVKASPEEKKEQKVTVDSLGRNFLIGAAAAAALVVVIAAAVLIVRMNRPVSQEDSQEAIEAVHVISGAANTEPTPEVTATPKPTPSDRTDSPLAKTAMAQQNPGPTATPKPEGDPVYVIPYGLNLRDGPGTG